MRHLHLLSIVSVAAAGSSRPTPDNDFYTREIELLAGLKSRLTGSENHKTFIDYLEDELRALNLTVHHDDFEFEYNTPPATPLSLSIGDQPFPPSALIPYSGNTGPEGVTGELLHLDVSTSGPIDWASAAGKIAVLEISEEPINGNVIFPVWAPSPAFGEIPGVPISNEGVRDLPGAVEAGVKGIIYAWTNLTALNAFGQYGPFKSSYQGVPAIYAADSVSAAVVGDAGKGLNATITSTGQLIQGRETRNLYVIVKGTEVRNESVIFSTHTDGSNLVEENGHIALLAWARQLAATPPRRTTILVFLTGHLHTSGFTKTGRVMQEWFRLHPELWAGNATDSLKAVFGSCVEHLGALAWREDIVNNIYYPTGQPQEEWLYAATPELNTMLQNTWRGATSNRTRVIDPNRSRIEQSGEGLPFLWHNIPEVSLCTSPDWLLKEWPAELDERQLVDFAAQKRQVESFLTLWDIVDGTPADALGGVDYARIPEDL